MSVSLHPGMPLRREEDAPEVQLHGREKREIQMERGEGVGGGHGGEGGGDMEGRKEEETWRGRRRKRHRGEGGGGDMEGRKEEETWREGRMRRERGWLRGKQSDRHLKLTWNSTHTTSSFDFLPACIFCLCVVKTILVTDARNWPSAVKSWEDHDVQL